VVPTLNVPGVGTELSVHVSEDTLAVRTVALDVVPTLVSRAFVDVELSARMLVVDLCASVCQDIMAIPTPDVSKESVTRTRTVDPRERVKTTSVWTPASCPVVKDQTVLSRTMSPSADVLVVQLAILSEVVEDSPEKRFVLHVELTQIVRLDLMTDPSADARLHTLAILCKAADTSVSVTMSVDQPRSVTDKTTDVRTPAVGEPVERTPIVRPSTTAPSAPVLQTSWAIPTPVATPSVPDMTNVLVTRPVSD